MASAGQRDKVRLLPPEVLREIFEYAAPRQRSLDKEVYKGAMRRSDLLHLALCCRAFCWPALELLWETLFWLSPLVSLLSLKPIQTLSRSAKMVQSLFIWHRLRRLHIPSSAHEVGIGNWTRAMSYTRLVRRIHIEVDEGLDGSACNYLISVLKGRPLFPGLSEIHWRCRPSFYPPSSTSPVSCSILLPWMVTDTLQSVNFYANKPLREDVRPYVIDFATRLHSHAPRLKNIEFGCIQEGASLHRPLISSFLCIDTLVDISYHVPGHSDAIGITCGLLSLPTLRCLSLIGEAEQAFSTFVACSSLPGMRGNVEVHLSAYTLKMSLFLESIPYLNVHRISLRGLGDGPAKGLPSRWDTCASICLRRFGQTLKDLELTEYSGNKGASFPAISPWFRLRDLQSFKYSIVEQTTICLDEANITLLASTWPTLQYLDLSDLANEGRMECPCLIILALELPHLKTLKVRLGRPDFPMYRVPLQSHPLRVMELSLIEDVYGVSSLISLARFIDRIFPLVDLSMIPLSYPAFAEVERLPEFLASIRRAE